RFRGSWPGFSTGPARDVCVLVGLAYVSLDEGGLLIADTSDLANPAVMGSIRFSGTGPVVASGHWAFLGVSGLQGIDVSDPGNPSRTTQFDVGTVHSLAADERHVYAATDVGLAVVELMEGAAPALVFTNWDGRGGRRLVLADQRLYAINDRALHIFNRND